MTEKYRHLYVVIEHEDGNFLPVSLEMVGEARRLVDGLNSKYSSRKNHRNKRCGKINENWWTIS